MKPLPSSEALHLNLVYDPFEGTLRWRQSGENFGKVRNSANGCGYLVGYFDGELYFAHRLIYKMMTGTEPDVVDHENHRRTDNRWKNLSNTTPLKNKQNMGVSKRNTSGYTGVSTDKDGKFRASICVNKKRIFLGSYGTAQGAGMARKRAERKYGFHPNHGTYDL